MPNANYFRKFDVLQVKIEEVNINHKPPIAKGRELQVGGIIDIDITNADTTPKVGEFWWIERQAGRWKLRNEARAGGTKQRGRVGKGDILLGFLVTEKKQKLEYQAYANFKAIHESEEGEPDKADAYVIEWAPCTKTGSIQPHHKIQQLFWSPGDETIDDPEDYDLPDSDNRHYAMLPGKVGNPKKWYWKARYRGTIQGKHGKWSAWSEPVLPINTGNPYPPLPELNLKFKTKECTNHPDYHGVITFRDVGWWDIPGYDDVDDVKSYHLQLEPIVPIYRLENNEDGDYRKIRLPKGLQTMPAQGAEYQVSKFDVIHDNKVFRRLDPKNHPRKRRNIRDKDEDDYPWSALGTLSQEALSIDDHIYVDETSFTWPIADVDDDLGYGVDGPDGDFIIRIINPDYDADSTEESPAVFSEYEDLYVKVRDKDPAYLQSDGPTTLDGNEIYHYEVVRAYWGPDNETAADNHSKSVAVEVYYPEHRYRAQFANIQRPDDIYWHARVRTEDRFNRKSPWGDWTDPILPAEDDSWLLPAPTGVAVDFDRVHRDRHRKWRAKVTWNEVKHIETECHNGKKNHVTHYGVQLANSDGTILVDEIAVAPTLENQILTLTGGQNQNEIQTITMPAATGGTFTLEWIGSVTSNIAFDTDPDVLATNIQAALIETFPFLDGSLTVTSTSPTTFDVEWDSDFANVDVSLIDGDGANLIMPPGGDNTILTAVSQEGNSSLFSLTFNDGDYEGDPLNITSASWSSVNEEITFEVASLKYVQNGTGPEYALNVGDFINVTGVRTTNAKRNGYNGDFVVTARNNANKTFKVDCASNPGVWASNGLVWGESNIEETDYISFDATAATIQTELEELSLIAPGDVSVTLTSDTGVGVNRIRTFDITFLAGGKYEGHVLPSMDAFVNRTDYSFDAQMTDDVHGGGTYMEVLTPHDPPKTQAELANNERFFVHITKPSGVDGVDPSYELFRVTDWDDTNKNEIMTLTVDEDTPANTFTINYTYYESSPDQTGNGQNRNLDAVTVSSELAWDATDAEYQDAFDKLFQGETTTGSNVTVTKITGPEAGGAFLYPSSSNRYHLYKIEFINDLAATDMQRKGEITLDPSTVNPDLFFAGDARGELPDRNQYGGWKVQHGGTKYYYIKRAQKGTENTGTLFDAEGYYDAEKDEELDHLYLFNWPYFHKRVAGERDKDKDNRAKAVFDQNIKKHHRYEARVRYFDAYSRKSEWSFWEPIEGATPDDQQAPPPPTITEAYVDDHGTKVHVEWEGPYDPNDADMMWPDFDHYQVQLWDGKPKSDGGTGKLLKFIKYTLRNKATIRVKKEFNSRRPFTVRVAAVDWSGNRSSWATRRNILPEKPQGVKGSRLRFQKHKTKHHHHVPTIDSILTWDEYRSSYFDLDYYQAHLQTGEVLGRVVSIEGAETFGYDDITRDQWWVTMLVENPQAALNPMTYPAEVEKEEVSIQTVIKKSTAAGWNITYILSQNFATNTLFKVGAKATVVTSTSDPGYEKTKTITRVTPNSFTVFSKNDPGTIPAGTVTATVTNGIAFSLTFSDHFHNSFDEMLEVASGPNGEPSREIVDISALDPYTDLAPVPEDAPLQGWKPVVVKYWLNRTTPTDTQLLEQNLEDALPFATDEVDLIEGAYSYTPDTEFSILPRGVDDGAFVTPDAVIGRGDAPATRRDGTMYLLILASQPTAGAASTVTISYADDDKVDIDGVLSDQIDWQDLALSGLNNFIITDLGMGAPAESVQLTAFYAKVTDDLPSGLTERISIEYSLSQDRVFAQIIRVDGVDLDAVSPFLKVMADGTNGLATFTQNISLVDVVESPEDDIYRAGYSVGIFASKFPMDLSDSSPGHILATEDPLEGVDFGPFWMQSWGGDDGGQGNYAIDLAQDRKESDDYRTPWAWIVLGFAPAWTRVDYDQGDIAYFNIAETKMHVRNTDRDRNNWNRAVFHNTDRTKLQRGRVAAVSKRFHTSRWSKWTPWGDPNDKTPPPAPLSVTGDVDHKRLHVKWSSPQDANFASQILNLTEFVETTALDFQIMLEYGGELLETGTISASSTSDSAAANSIENALNALTLNDGSSLDASCEIYGADGSHVFIVTFGNPNVTELMEIEEEQEGFISVYWPSETSVVARVGVLEDNIANNATSFSVREDSSVNDDLTVPFNIQIDNEEMTVTNRAAPVSGVSTYTVVRGANGTTAVAHDINSEVTGNDSEPVDDNDTAYYQVRVKDARTKKIIRGMTDRYVKGNTKTFRISHRNKRQSRIKNYIVEVRAVDASGNGSKWVRAKISRSGVPSIPRPIVTFGVRDDKDRPYYVIANWLSPEDENDEIRDYEIQAQQSFSTRLRGDRAVGATSINVLSSRNTPRKGGGNHRNFTAWIGNEQISVTNVSGHVWTIAATTQAHKKGERVYFFSHKSKIIDKKHIADRYEGGIEIIDAQLTGNNLTYTTDSNHGFIDGDEVSIAQAVPAGWNFSNTSVQSHTSDTFTIDVTGQINSHKLNSKKYNKGGRVWDAQVDPGDEGPFDDDGGRLQSASVTPAQKDSYYRVRIRAFEKGGKMGAFSPWSLAKRADDSSVAFVPVDPPENVRVIKRHGNQIVKWYYDPEELKNIDKFQVKLYKEVMAEADADAWNVDDDAIWQRYNVITDTTWGIEITDLSRTNNVLTVTTAGHPFDAQVGDEIKSNVTIEGIIEDDVIGRINGEYGVIAVGGGNTTFTVASTGPDFTTGDYTPPASPGVVYTTGAPMLTFTFSNNAGTDEASKPKDVPFIGWDFTTQGPLQIQVEGIEPESYNGTYTLSSADQILPDQITPTSFWAPGPIDRPEDATDFTDARVVYYNTKKAFDEGRASGTRLIFDSIHRQHHRGETKKTTKWYAIVRAVGKNRTTSEWVLNGDTAFSNLPAVQNLDMIVDQRHVQVKWDAIDLLDEESRAIRDYPLSAAAYVGGSGSITFTLTSNAPTSWNVTSGNREGVTVVVDGMDDAWFNREWEIWNSSGTDTVVVHFDENDPAYANPPTSPTADDKFYSHYDGEMTTTQNGQEDVGSYLVELFRHQTGGSAPLNKAVDSSIWTNNGDGTYTVTAASNYGKIHPEPDGGSAGDVYSWGKNNRKASHKVQGTSTTFNIPKPGPESKWAARVRAINDSGLISKNAAAALAKDDIPGGDNLPTPHLITINDAAPQGAWPAIKWIQIYGWNTPSLIDSCSFEASGTKITTSIKHNLEVGDAVIFTSSGTLPTPINEATIELTGDALDGDHGGGSPLEDSIYYVYEVFDDYIFKIDDVYPAVAAIPFGATPGSGHTLYQLTYPSDIANYIIEVYSASAVGGGQGATNTWFNNNENDNLLFRQTIDARRVDADKNGFFSTKIKSGDLKNLSGTGDEEYVFIRVRAQDGTPRVSTWRCSANYIKASVGGVAPPHIRGF